MQSLHGDLEFQIEHFQTWMLAARCFFPPGLALELQLKATARIFHAPWAFSKDLNVFGIVLPTSNCKEKLCLNLLLHKQTFGLMCSGGALYSR